MYEGFDGVGVSIDLFGGLRVNLAGRDFQDTVLGNMDELRKAGVDFGCITVLSKQNVHRAADLSSFLAGRHFLSPPSCFSGCDRRPEQRLLIVARRSSRILQRVLPVMDSVFDPDYHRTTVFLHRKHTGGPDFKSAGRTRRRDLVSVRRSRLGKYLHCQHRW